MDAIILAGGKGTRLKSVINNVPKPLAPVNGIPFLDVLLHQLDKSNCVEKVILAVGYKAEQIIENYENCSKYRFEIIFSIEKEALGTGGAIKMAIANTNSDSFLVLNGDSYTDVNISKLIHTHNVSKASMTMVLREVENANRYGSVLLDENQRIIKFEEKINDSNPGLINAGIYVINKELFNEISVEKSISMELEIIPDILERASIFGYISQGKFVDIGIPETYKNSGKYLLDECR